MEYTLVNSSKAKRAKGIVKEKGGNVNDPEEVLIEYLRLFGHALVGEVKRKKGVKGQMLPYEGQVIPHRFSDPEGFARREARFLAKKKAKVEKIEEVK